MVKFTTLFFNFMLIGLAIFSIFSFISNFQDNNGVTEKLMDNALMNESFGELQTDLRTLRDQSQAQKTLFESENPTSGFGTILLFSIVSSGKVFNGFIVSIFNSVIKLPQVVFSLDPVITSIISSILLLSIIIGLWIVYKLGG